MNPIQNEQQIKTLYIFILFIEILLSVSLNINIHPTVPTSTALHRHLIQQGLAIYGLVFSVCGSNPATATESRKDVQNLQLN